MKAPATIKFFVCFFAMLIMFSLVGSVPASAQFIQPPNGQYNLEGCRNNGTISFGVNGPFVCPDAAYTSGNLGKGWNELDLVPFRLTTSTQNGVQVTTYNIIVAGEYINSGALGWDYIGSDIQPPPPAGPTAPEKHTGSDNSCSASWTDYSTAGPGIGGSNASIYRILTIHQNPGTTCIWDYYMRLALGSHLYPGSSLHGFKFNNADLTTNPITFKGADQDVPLPVNQILPQSLSKTMGASQGSTNVWEVGKEVPASLSFANICDPQQALSKSVQITVSWTKTPTLGGIDITTTITATNPAARTITVNVTDNIYIGTDQSNLLDTLSTPVGGVDVPPNTSMTVLTHTTTDSNTSDTDFNDVATASYIDKATGIPVPGTTTATASATKQSLTGTNNSATISDQEDITGNFKFRLDSFNGTGGYTGGAVTAPSPYNLGVDFVTSLTWLSSSFSADGTATFNKTVEYNGTGPSSTKLTDTATLTGSDGFVTDSGKQTVAIEADALVSLTIQKTISPFVAQTVTFHVTNSALVEVATPTITFAAGDPSTKSTTVNNLAPDTYTVTEDVPTGWDGTPASVPLTLDASTQTACSGTASFTNTQRGTIVVKKVTSPVGGTGFTFTGDAAGTIDDGGNITVNNLVPGTYTSTESAKTGWDLTKLSCTTDGSASGSTATFNLHAGETITCTFTNTQEGTIIIKKVTNPSGISDTFSFSGDVSGTLGDGGTASKSNLAPGTYTSTEADPTPKWDLTSITCDDGSSATPSSGSVSTRTATFKLDAGETVTCTFKNTERGKAKVVKTVSGVAPSGSQAFTFQLRQGASMSAAGTILESGVANAADGGVINFSTYLVPGSTYQLCEQMMPGWTTTLGPPDFSVYNPSGDNSIVCTDFTVTAGQTKTFNINNTPPPGGMALTIGYWKNWSSCSGGGQKHMLDTTLFGAQALTSPFYPGISVGDLKLYTSLTADPDTFCKVAVNILSKATANGSKASSSPAYNMAAQLLGAELNLAAGAGPGSNTMGCLLSDIQWANDILNPVTDAFGNKGIDFSAAFYGNNANPKMTTTEINDANYLQTQLNAYNNNLPYTCSTSFKF